MGEYLKSIVKICTRLNKIINFRTENSIILDVTYLKKRIQNELSF